MAREKKLLLSELSRCVRDMEDEQVSDVAREYAIVQANGQKLNVVTVMKEKTVLETSTYYQKYLYLLIFQLIMAVLVVVWIYLRMIRDDRIYIKNLNKRLELSEETYRVTARNNDVCI